MHIEEKKNLDTFIEDVPVGGVFKSLSGRTFMKIVSLHEIQAVNLANGCIYNFGSEARVEYFEKAKVILEH